MDKLDWISSLDSDSLLTICSFLSLEDLLNLRCACYRTRTEASSNSIWRNRFRDDFSRKEVESKSQEIDTSYWFRRYITIYSMMPRLVTCEDSNDKFLTVLTFSITCPQEAFMQYQVHKACAIVSLLCVDGNIASLHDLVRLGNKKIGHVGKMKLSKVCYHILLWKEEVFFSKAHNEHVGIIPFTDSLESEPFVIPHHMDKRKSIADKINNVKGFGLDYIGKFRDDIEVRSRYRGDRTLFAQKYVDRFLGDFNDLASADAWRLARPHNRNRFLDSFCTPLVNDSHWRGSTGAMLSVYKPKEKKVVVLKRDVLPDY